MNRTVSPDKETDKKYAAIRDRHGAGSGRANGYRLHRYFVAEQALLMELMGPVRGTVVDLACGSGLMGLPLRSTDCAVIGLDFNAAACSDSAANGLPVVRGNAYALPFADASIDHAFACQFFNQQRPEQVDRMITECARVMRSGGRLIFVWRNHDAWIHRVAHALFTLSDLITRQPRFPVYRHPLRTLEQLCRAAGFARVDALVSFPLLGWHSRRLNSLGARAIGASCILVLERNSRV